MAGSQTYFNSFIVVVGSFLSFFCLCDNFVLLVLLAFFLNCEKMTIILLLRLHTCGVQVWGDMLVMLTLA